jgi:hypothetical protein
MVNNSISINKTNNHISPSPSPIEQDKDHDKCRWKFQDLGQAQLYGGVKPDNVSWREQFTFWYYDDGVRFVLDQHAGLNFHSGSSRNNSPRLHMYHIYN